MHGARQLARAKPGSLFVVCLSPLGGFCRQRRSERTVPHSCARLTDRPPDPRRRSLQRCRLAAAEAPQSSGGIPFFTVGSSAIRKLGSHVVALDSSSLVAPRLPAFRRALGRSGRIAHKEEVGPARGPQLPNVQFAGHSPEARERYVKRYTTVVSVSAGSGVGSPYISHECPADSL